MSNARVSFDVGWAKARALNILNLKRTNFNTLTGACVKIFFKCRRCELFSLNRQQLDIISYITYFGRYYCDTKYFVPRWFFWNKNKTGHVHLGLERAESRESRECSTRAKQLLRYYISIHNHRHVCCPWCHQPITILGYGSLKSKKAYACFICCVIFLIYRWTRKTSLSSVSNIT